MSLEKMLFIEDNIESIKSKTILELAQNNYSLMEIDYILRAIKLPYNEVVTFIEQGIDLETLPQSKEIAELCIKWGSDVDSIMKRIHELRRIMVFKSVQGNTRQ